MKERSKDIIEEGDEVKAEYYGKGIVFHIYKDRKNCVVDLEDREMNCSMDSLKLLRKAKDIKQIEDKSE